MAFKQGFNNFLLFLKEKTNLLGLVLSGIKNSWKYEKDYYYQTRYEFYKQFAMCIKKISQVTNLTEILQ
jgi:hypothetical protein